MHLVVVEYGVKRVRGDNAPPARGVGWGGLGTVKETLLTMILLSWVKLGSAVACDN